MWNTKYNLLINRDSFNINIHRVQIDLVTEAENWSRHTVFIIMSGHIFLRFSKDSLGFI